MQAKIVLAYWEAIDQICLDREYLLWQNLFEIINNPLNRTIGSSDGASSSTDDNDGAYAKTLESFKKGIEGFRSRFVEESDIKNAFTSYHMSQSILF
jgi:hypothetical protein